MSRIFCVDFRLSLFRMARSQHAQHASHETIRDHRSLRLQQANQRWKEGPRWCCSGLLRPAALNIPATAVYVARADFDRFDLKSNPTKLLKIKCVMCLNSLVGIRYLGSEFHINETKLFDPKAWSACHPSILDRFGNVGVGESVQHSAGEMMALTTMWVRPWGKRDWQTVSNSFTIVNPKIVLSYSILEPPL